jgi:hypothetical protein
LRMVEAPETSSFLALSRSSISSTSGVFGSGFRVVQLWQSPFLSGRVR